MTRELRPIEVMELAPDGSDFRLTKELVDALNASTNPFLILFFGNSRAGKSTRINQVVTKRILPTGPLRALAGFRPVTHGFQAIGPLSFEHLFQTHGISLPTVLSIDLFLVDCEGMNSLEQSSPGLKKAIFSLIQISNLHVLVRGDPVSYANLNSICALFGLRLAFSQELEGFAVGTVIMQRDVGVDCDGMTSLDDRDKRRLSEDNYWCEKFLEEFRRKHVLFGEGELQVLLQPDFSDPELYWKSMNDFISYVHAIASKRRIVTSMELLARFDTVKNQIKAVDRMEIPDVEAIFRDVVDSYLS
jgi:hypothetical protein